MTLETFDTALARLGTAPGWFSHLHHAEGFPFEYSDNIRGRLEYIRDHKPPEEQPLRFASIRRLTPEQAKAWDKADKVRDKADKAWAKADKARDNAWAKADKAWDKAAKAWAKADKARDKAWAKADKAWAKAWAKADKARAKADKARAKAWDKAAKVRAALHLEVCPSTCLWDTVHHSIFGEAK